MTAAPNQPHKAEKTQQQHNRTSTQSRLGTSRTVNTISNLGKYSAPHTIHIKDKEMAVDGIRSNAKKSP
jgi:hypothetical protein